MTNEPRWASRLRGEAAEASRLRSLSNRDLVEQYFGHANPELVVTEMVRRLCPEWLGERERFRLLKWIPWLITVSALSALFFGAPYG